MNGTADGPVLVTGSSGFIGRALVARLARAHAVIALDRSSASSATAFPPCSCGPPASTTTRATPCSSRTRSRASTSTPGSRSCISMTWSALAALVERRKQLPPELPLLLAEEHTPTVRELQHEIGRLVHGEAWKTVEIPASLARVGAALEEKMLEEDPFIRPWMVDSASEHYEIDISRAKRLLDWRPRRSLRATLPKIIASLKADPAGWYRSNKLNPAVVADRSPRDRERDHQRTDVEVHLAHLAHLLHVHVHARHVVAVVVGVLHPGADDARHEPRVDDGHVGSAGRMELLPVDPPAAPADRRARLRRLRDRAPAHGLPARHVDGVWEPFFVAAGGRNGTETIITSDVSKAWPIADAGLGAVSYLFEVLMGVMGDRRRWRTMPWMVAAFGIVVVPLGVVSIYFIIISSRS